MSILNNTPIDVIRDLVKTSISYSDILRKLKLSTNGSTNHRTLKKFLIENNIDTSHFTIVNPNRKAQKPKHAFEDILIVNSKYTNMSRLKLRLIEANYLEYKCNICGIYEWLNQPISLQLDHINGVHSDNRLENLRFLCPNCHSQTPTYAGRNKKTDTFNHSDTHL